jgi:hypothetical protein
MSLNNIISTTLPGITNPDFYGYVNGWFDNLTVDSSLILPMNDFNRPNYTLQCYDSNSAARFLPPPVFNNLDHDTFVIVPITTLDAEGFFEFEDEAVADNFELDDDTTISCIQGGLYLVTTKVSKANGTFYMNNTLYLNDAPVDISFSATPFVPGSRNFNCNYASFLLNIEAGDDIRLQWVKGPDGNDLDLSTGDYSYVSFVKINAN